VALTRGKSQQKPQSHMSTNLHALLNHLCNATAIGKTRKRNSQFPCLTQTHTHSQQEQDRSSQFIAFRLYASSLPVHTAHSNRLLMKGRLNSRKKMQRRQVRRKTCGRPRQAKNLAPFKPTFLKLLSAHKKAGNYF
jgi:hypothetical protein